MWEHLLRAVDAASPARPLVRAAALLHHAGTGSEPMEVAGSSAAIARELLRRDELERGLRHFRKLVPLRIKRWYAALADEL